MNSWAERAGGRSEWTALGVFTVSYMAASLMGMSAAPLAPYIQDDLGLTKAQIGFFISLLYLGSALTGYAAGWLSDQWSISKTIVAGLVLEAVFIGGLWAAKAFAVMLVFYLVAGLGYGTINPATSKGVIFWFPPERRATAMAVKQMGYTVGGVVGSVMLPFLAEAFGWRVSIAIGAAAALTGGMVSTLFYPASAERHRNAPPPIPPVGDDGEIVPGVREADDKGWTKQVIIWSLIGNAFTALQGVGTVYLALYMVKEFSYHPVAAGVVLATAQVGGAFGRVAWGWISDRWFRESRKRELALIGFIGAAMSIFLGVLPTETPHLVIGLLAAVFGFTAIGYNAVFLTSIGEIAGPEKAGRATGLAITIVYLGLIVGPPVFGLIVDWTDSFKLAWITFGAVLALVSGLALLMARPAAQSLILEMKGD